MKLLVAILAVCTVLASICHGIQGSWASTVATGDYEPTEKASQRWSATGEIAASKSKSAILSIGTYGKANARYSHIRARKGASREIRILLHYTACSGLINQVYSHIAALILTSALGSQLVLPPALMRNSFASYFSPFKNASEVVWTPKPLSMLLDVDRMIKHWHTQGITLHKTPPMLNLPDWRDPDKAWPVYANSGNRYGAELHLSRIYQKAWDLKHLTQMVRKAARKKAQSLASQHPADHINVYLPCTFFMLHLPSESPWSADVARGIYFAPKLVAMANDIIESMRSRGAEMFNSIHLRIEQDARDWTTIMGGKEMVKRAYASAMKSAEFNSSTPLYVASALLTYGAREEMIEVERDLKSMGFCSMVHTKEMYMQATDLQGLASEQLALVDFLVLAEGYRFVGFGSSTFSFYLQQFRALQGLSLGSSVLVNTSAITTDSLFARAAIVTPATL